MFNGRPLRRVEVTGIVVGKEESSAVITYTVDDGTGLLPCVYWFPMEDRVVSSRKTLSLGDLVKVSGRLGEFRFQRQITINSITVENDMNMEAFRWLEILDLKTSFYTSPTATLSDTELEATMAEWLRLESMAAPMAESPEELTVGAPMNLIFHVSMALIELSHAF
ncbi:uncharacterized protein EV422DRAFT_516723 [Fimicolochytrium jonesii]|uniref:uncharacterized protein n=1 Tax=Fimicolochytrium jonesii TaxID=1396493 RepID=UPI0022FE899E|nr:uncharacterized protein EV422DRAFT_516723 [Fimicolochytrium jonesii]KAI8824902.1 hypothetical protein EV422DRAFT_516723 [Fimicolochytrium jonesii]